MKYFLALNCAISDDGYVCDEGIVYFGRSKGGAIEEADELWESYSLEYKECTKIEVCEFELDDDEVKGCNIEEIFNLCCDLSCQGEYKICYLLSLR